MRTLSEEEGVELREELEDIRTRIEDCPHPLFHYKTEKHDLSLCKLPALHQELISERQRWEIQNQDTGDIFRFASFTEAEEWIMDKLDFTDSNQNATGDEK